MSGSLFDSHVQAAHLPSPATYEGRLDPLNTPATPTQALHCCSLNGARVLCLACLGRGAACTWLPQNSNNVAEGAHQKIFGYLEKGPHTIR